MAENGSFWLSDLGHSLALRCRFAGQAQGYKQNSSVGPKAREASSEWRARSWTRRRAAMKVIRPELRSLRSGQGNPAGRLTGSVPRACSRRRLQLNAFLITKSSSKPCGRSHQGLLRETNLRAPNCPKSSREQPAIPSAARSASGDLVVPGFRLREILKLQHVRRAVSVVHDDLNLLPSIAECSPSCRAFLRCRQESVSESHSPPEG